MNSIQPWAVTFIGFLAAAFGGFLTFIGFDTDTTGILMLGWALGGLGSLVLSVGLIALAVQIGVAAADR